MNKQIADSLISRMIVAARCVAGGVDPEERLRRAADLRNLPRQRGARAALAAALVSDLDHGDVCPRILAICQTEREEDFLRFSAKLASYPGSEVMHAGGVPGSFDAHLLIRVRAWGSNVRHVDLATQVVPRLALFDGPWFPLARETTNRVRRLIEWLAPDVDDALNEFACRTLWGHLAHPDNARAVVDAIAHDNVAEPVRDDVQYAIATASAVRLRQFEQVEAPQSRSQREWFASARDAALRYRVDGASIASSMEELSRGRRTLIYSLAALAAEGDVSARDAVETYLRARVLPDVGNLGRPGHLATLRACVAGMMSVDTIGAPTAIDIVLAEIFQKTLPQLDSGIDAFGGTRRCLTSLRVARGDVEYLRSRSLDPTSHPYEISGACEALSRPGIDRGAAEAMLLPLLQSSRLHWADEILRSLARASPTWPRFREVWERAAPLVVNGQHLTPEVVAALVSGSSVDDVRQMTPPTAVQSPLPSTRHIQPRPPPTRHIQPPNARVLTFTSALALRGETSTVILEWWRTMCVEGAATAAEVVGLWTTSRDALIAQALSGAVSSSLVDAFLEVTTSAPTLLADLIQPLPNIYVGGAYLAFVATLVGVAGVDSDPRASTLGDAVRVAWGRMWPNPRAVVSENHGLILHRGLTAASLLGVEVKLPPSVRAQVDGDATVVRALRALDVDLERTSTKDALSRALVAIGHGNEAHPASAISRLMLHNLGNRNDRQLKNEGTELPLVEVREWTAKLRVLLCGPTVRVEDPGAVVARAVTLARWAVKGHPTAEVHVDVASPESVWPIAETAAVLLCEELIANAMKYGIGPVSVRDGGPTSLGSLLNVSAQVARPEETRDAVQGAMGGSRGLRFAAELAGRWGCALGATLDGDVLCVSLASNRQGPRHVPTEMIRTSEIWRKFAQIR